jgi:C-8 sterol isomerase
MRHVFCPEVLREVARDAIAAHPKLDDKVAFIRDELARRYPGHVRPENDWVFNIAGGSMGHMTILHASITEYVIVFGTPIGTEGYSGRFMADDWFIILEGEQWAYDEGGHQKAVYKPGEMHHMPRGVARGYRMPDHCYALEYARGIIPSMLPFGLADSFTSTLDHVPVMKTMRIYARAVIGQLLGGRGAHVPPPRAERPRNEGAKPYDYAS